MPDKTAPPATTDAGLTPDTGDVGYSIRAGCCPGATVTSAPMPTSDLATEELDYPLPPELIATRPARPRDAARMMVVSRSGDGIEHACVRDLPDYLRAGDAMVFNTTAVTPARFRGRRAGTGGRVDGLFIEHAGAEQWVVMLRSNGRLRAGDRIELLDRDRRRTPHLLELVEPHPEGWTVAVQGGTDVLDRVGLTPLPPYILKARHGSEVADDLDRAWYQTVYADPAQRRSVAAPTAGLHFTLDLLARLRAAGVGRIDVTLHVGPGTFRPITAPTLAGHVMHAEHYSVEPKAIAALQSTGGRIFAVGTTTVRTLESLPYPLPAAARLNGPIQGCTELLIAPPYEPRNFAGLLTNLHLPRSTLLALVGAVIGLDRLKAIYAEAAQRRYRFYSYGDAMLILP